MTTRVTVEVPLQPDYDAEVVVTGGNASVRTLVPAGKTERFNIYGEYSLTIREQSKERNNA